MASTLADQSYTASLFDLTGKVALVTGATGRLGREMSFALAEMGADLAIVARTQEPLNALKAEIEKATGCDVLPIAADARHANAIEEIFEQVEAAYERLDVLVNNVTGVCLDPVETMSEATWDTALHDTLTGLFLCAQAAGRRMLKQGSGSIINIASIYGVVAADPRIYADSELNSSAVYGAGKAGVIQLTRYLAATWAGKGVRVNTITPGGVEDPSNNHAAFRTNYESRTPMQRMMQREEIRGPLVFLASDAASYVTGHNLIVDGGFTVV